MLVFHKERLVFLSVPKTGTTAWQAALSTRADIVISDPPELKHAPVYRYNRFFHPMFQKVTKTDMELIAVMREPIDWLGSWYRYRRRPFMEGKRNTTHDVSFDEFVQAYCQSKPPGFANVGSQAKFLEPRPNGVGVSRIFRYEAPDQLRQFLQDRLQVEIKLDRLNVSPKLELDLRPETKALLRDARSEEFALYDSLAAGS